MDAEGERQVLLLLCCTFNKTCPGWATKEKDSAASPLHALTEDSSSKFWAVYIAEAERYDSALMESWKADMDGMLIFSGLFSASLTAFIIESYKNLVPDTGDMTVSLLSQISDQLSSQSNGSHFTVSPSPPFEVPTSALVCNGLWFVSLGLSLTCALLATLVEQFAREFMHTKLSESTLHRFGLHAIVDIIPLLLHLGLVLFFAGLAVFLVPINSLMAGIVTSVLVIFVTLYLMITVLPTISLDCPYRTPLSSIFWRCLQSAAMLFQLPSTASNLTDAVLAAAMQRRDIRDERAVLWTLEALRDNTELLPFVEATHEIIDGPTGLRAVDDHLFRLVLQTADAHTSLPRRILSLLWSAETLPLQDPLRERRQLAGLRALWALGIVTARITRAPAGEVYIGRTSLHALRIPQEYRLSLNAVISWVHLKSIQARFEDIRTMLSGRDLSVPREQRKLIQFLRTALPALDNDCQRAKIWSEVQSLLMPLTQLANSDPEHWGSGDDFEVARRVMEQQHDGHAINWAYHFAKIAVQLVSTALYEGVAPYRLQRTCKEIVSQVMSVPEHLLPIFSPSFVRGLPWVPASFQAFLGDPAQNDLDVIMRCALRLLPLLDHKTFVHFIHWYISNRAGDDNWQYALSECRLDILATAMMVDIGEKDTIDEPALRTIVKLCLWSKEFVSVLDCETILAVVARTPPNALGSASTAAKAILCARIFAVLASKIGPSRTDPQDEMRLIREIASHPLLNKQHGTDINQARPVSLEQTREQLLRQLSDCYATEFITFLSECTLPMLPPYEAEATLKHLRREWDPFLRNPKAVSVSTQRAFARAIFAAVECAHNDTHPHQASLHAIVQGLCEHLDPDGKLREGFTDPESVTVLAQAMDRVWSSEFFAHDHNPVLTSPVDRRPGRAFSVDAGSQNSPIIPVPAPWAHWHREAIVS
ncbi:hypothetical protein MSAN_02423500 [Mycena sanguinolenta]|uniref:DUF6535 domain-containing protein n=1 Tax=Mycena sanguinolenta TaxID=230812 RepID=A0A8H6X2M5_9AGAR|nr:hypothetical protein MSAN_02423500 [Mycena sanguinolenta]